MCVWFMTRITDIFFVLRSNDSFNFPLGLIQYIVIVVIVLSKETSTMNARIGESFNHIQLNNQL